MKDITINMDIDVDLDDVFNNMSSSDKQAMFDNLVDAGYSIECECCLSTNNENLTELVANMNTLTMSLEDEAILLKIIKKYTF